MQDTSIEWTSPPGFEGGMTWNPLRGCAEVGPECEHCYARVFAERFRGVAGHAYEHGFDFRLAPFKLHEPLMQTKPHTVFVNSMSDIFFGKAPTEYIREICRIMLEANWHVYQVLTKRSKRMCRLLAGNDEVFQRAADASHIWWGVSCGTRKEGCPRLDDLQETNVRVAWVSLEPLLEDLGDALNLDGVKWAVVGGESGFGHRPMKKSWVQRVYRECRRKGVPFFFKQWGGHPKGESGRTLNDRTYDEYPTILEENILHHPCLPPDERLRAIDCVKQRARAWLRHPLLAPVPKSQQTEFPAGYGT